jgi:hypothetical protein
MLTWRKDASRRRRRGKGRGRAKETTAMGGGQQGRRG